MEWNGEIYISRIYKKEDFINLRLDKYSSNKKWERAIKIFRDRIEGRFFYIIDRIISNEHLEVEGFSVMAINCLLIETLLQFKEGFEESPSGRISEVYTKFLNQEFGHVFTDIDLAKRFYTDIRCGILHSAQTKGCSRLSVGGRQIIIPINDGDGISVDVEGLSNEIRKYFNRYIENLRCIENEELRENFLKKMKSICKESRQMVFV